MEAWKRLTQLGACGVTASAFGVLAGIGGLTHGIGEVIQGNVAVDGVFLDSWTTGPIASNMGGEPGLTVLPTALWAGVVTLAFSAAVLVWSVAGTRRSHRGTVLVFLSAGMLAAGGGVGPPVIGMLAGVIGRFGPDRQPTWILRRSDRTLRFLARAWRPLFTLALANGVFLVVGSVILVFTIDLDMPALFEVSFYLTVMMLALLLAAAPAHDSGALDSIDAIADAGSVGSAAAAPVDSAAPSGVVAGRH